MEQSLSSWTSTYGNWKTVYRWKTARYGAWRRGARWDTSQQYESATPPAVVGGRTQKELTHRKREKTNYDVMDCVRRMVLIGNEKGDIDGILIEWEEVRISDNCAQTLLKLQNRTNAIEQFAEGEVVFRF